MFRKAQLKPSTQIIKGLGLPLSVAVLAGCSINEELVEPLKSGKQVYEETCSACHGNGAAGAPKFRHREHWEPLLEEGQVVLSAHGWVGMGAMPPKGGNPGLTLEEFSRAVVYMARGTGADWQDPDPAMLHEIREEVAERKRALSHGE